MLLESLLKLVETLRERIDTHGAALRQSEALTRYALIDPLLRELGWNTEDPALVVPEFRLGKGYADYALMNNGKPAMMVEAKKLDNPLQEAASQGIGYCIEDGIAYFAVTDGRLWEIYETHKVAKTEKKIIVRFDLTGAPAETCLQALALWRRSVIAGKVSPAQQPLIAAEQPQQSGTPAVIAQPMAPPQETAPSMPFTSEASQPPAQQTLIQESVEPAQRTDPGDDVEWIPLPAFSPQMGEAPPIEMRFPHGNTVQIENWSMLLSETVRWLYENGHITESNPHVRTMRNSSIVSDSPVHPNGQPFNKRRSVGPLYVDTGGNRQAILRKAHRVLSRTGQDPAQIGVRLSPHAGRNHQTPVPQAANLEPGAQPTYTGSDNYWEWTPISKFPAKNVKEPPASMQFPDRSTVQIENWTMLLTETVRWLYENGHITKEKPHILSLRGSGIVSDAPFYPDRPFHKNSKPVGPLYVNTHGDRQVKINKIRRILSRTGQDPTQFKVRLSS